MITTTAPASFRYSRTDAGYLVHRGSEYLGSVARDGRAWIISDTARGSIESGRYATRIDAVDALAALLRGAAALDALPTDDDVVEVAPADAAIELAAKNGETSQCARCRYYSGHTSWCPLRHAEQPAEQLTLEAPSACPTCAVTIAGAACFGCGTVQPQDPTAPRDGEAVAVWAARAYGEDGPDEVGGAEHDRATPVAELDDRQLWVQFMLEDRALGYGGSDGIPEPDDERHGALLAEIARRFGPDATELTADHAVATHASADDLVRWAVLEHDHLVGIATGRITPWWRRDDEVGVELVHANCEPCERFVDSAVGIMRATGSTGAKYGTAGPGVGEHGATVTRGGR